MGSFFDKDDYSFDDVQALIDNNVEESINLDFKASGALAKTDDKRREIAKDVSAFANSDGGIIVYGITEKNHKADSLSFIDGDDITKEWIEQVINTGVQRHIDGLKIFPIRKDGDINQSIYIVKIPYSYNVPHISKDKRYYKRFNFESVFMEEYEVRQLYDRKSKSKLFIAGYSIKNIDLNEDEATFRIHIDVANEGLSVEDLYKINLYIDEETGVNCAMKFTWDRHINPNDYQILTLDERIKISCKGQFPIFPNECVNAMMIQVVVKRDKLDVLQNDSIIELKLFYSNGEDEAKIKSSMFVINESIEIE